MNLRTAHGRPTDHRQLRGNRLKRRLAFVIVTAQLVLVATALPASGSEPATALVLAPEPILVAGGAGTQTEPHVSGSLVSFTNQGSTTSEIRYRDVAGTSPSAGIDNSSPTGGTAYRDSISDVSGSVIVFRRASDSSSTESIMFFDSANPWVGPQVLADAPGTQRQAAAIGGTTVAFEQKTGNTLIRDICIASTSTPSAAAVCVTSSDVMNRDPAVSPDGNTVVWSRCTGLLSGCDIWAASKNAAGGWDAPRALTSDGGNDIFPDTNGTLVTWASRLDGNSDIYFANLDGSGTVRLAIADVDGSSEENPNISGTRISFQRRTALGQPADLYVYHLLSDTLYQLTETAADEKLSDISTNSSGQSWVVWAAVDPVTNSDDVWAASFWLSDLLPETPSYEVCPLFEQSRSYRLGSTVPVRMQLCDTDGTNLSSSSLVVTATGLVKVDASASTALVEDSGNANPDNNFRYDESLQGYIYNLATRGLSAGTWELQFTVSGDPDTYAVRFDIR
jgi:hypothetical protein